MPELGVLESSTDLHAGLLVADKYQLIGCVGRGGMGEVWKARHASLGHDVAVKFLATGQLSRSALSRFEREARVSARLGEMSRHIVRAYDHGTLGERPFVVMELLSGESLAECLKRERTLPPAAIVRVVDHLCKALMIAHGEGVVHRDLKPANVFVSRLPEDHDFVVKLLDFGVAKGCIGNDDSVPSGSLVGTLSYMSPEQILGEPQIDGRADLWAVGVLAYRMAVGRTPFSFGDRGDLVARILGGTPPRACEQDHRFPLAFDTWVSKALAKKPDDRFADARELARCLSEALGLDAAESQPSMPMPALPPPSVAPELPRVERESEPGHTESATKHGGSSIEANPVSRRLVPESVSLVATSELIAPRPTKVGQRVLLAAVAVLLLSLASPHFGKTDVPRAVRATTMANRPPVVIASKQQATVATPTQIPAREASSQRPREMEATKGELPTAQRANNQESRGAAGSATKAPTVGIQTRSKQLWDSDEGY